MCVICIPLCTYFICWSNISRLQLVCFTFTAHCKILQAPPPPKQTKREIMMMCQNNIILYRVQAYTLQKQGEILKNTLKTLVFTVTRSVPYEYYTICNKVVAFSSQILECGAEKRHTKNNARKLSYYIATSPTSTHTLLNIL